MGKPPPCALSDKLNRALQSIGFRQDRQNEISCALRASQALTRRTQSVSVTSVLLTARFFATCEEKQIPRCARDDRWVDLVPYGWAAGPCNTLNNMSFRAKRSGARNLLLVAASRPRCVEALSSHKGHKDTTEIRKNLRHPRKMTTSAPQNGRSSPVFAPWCPCERSLVYSPTALRLEVTRESSRRLLAAATS